MLELLLTLSGSFRKWLGKLIYGTVISQNLRNELAIEVDTLKESGVVPCLSVVLVGDNPASEIYVAKKKKAASDIGMKAEIVKLSVLVSQDDLLGEIIRLNKNPDVHGIIVQLPLPEHINKLSVLEAVIPEKDVDGFNPINVGKMIVGDDCFLPCTPQGCITLIKEHFPSIRSKSAVVVGASSIVGKPLAYLLLNEGCTVSILHIDSKKSDVKNLCSQADILISATGVPGLITGDFVKPGAMVVDVGISRVVVDGKKSIVGDVDFENVIKVAGAVTPVPGGVGPMTVAYLLLNTVKAAKLISDNKSV